MDIEKLRQAVIDERFILSANPDWREGRACGISDDETEQKANDALTIILENIAELVVAYLIDDRQTVKSEEVQEAIEQLMYGSWQSSKDGYPITLGDKTIDLAIAALQEYQPWVPVSERLPEKRLYVLTYRKNGNSKVLRFENDCKWYDSYNEWETDVTHWKPLPEPPKGE